MDSIQFCMDEAVKKGLISPAKNINFAEWTEKRYENIPQQTDGYAWPHKLLFAYTNKITDI